jgi:hypothetical protein
MVFLINDECFCTFLNASFADDVNSFHSTCSKCSHFTATNKFMKMHYFHIFIFV